MLDEIDEPTCLELLAGAGIGRIVVSVGALPAAFPVNMAVHDGEVLFWTGQGTKLAAAVSGAVVAVEVDEVDRATKSGWSVLVVGRSRVVDDPRTVQWAIDHGLESWADGVHGEGLHLVGVSLTLVSGRRVGVSQLSSR